MEKKTVTKYGLIGKEIDYSFSRGYFAEKFTREQLANNQYDNYDCTTIDDLKQTLAQKDIAGLNVTIPYKETVLPMMDSLSEQAREIGAVNTIIFKENGHLEGHNTDAYGFEKALFGRFDITPKKALILGTGGASKAIEFVLKKRGIQPQFVSRKRTAKALPYSALTPEIIQSHLLIINCTPLGTFPKVDEAPEIAYTAITHQHVLFDLIYNPEKTRFMQLGEKQGARVANGHQMLIHQAERSWALWNP